MADVDFFFDPVCPWAWITSRWVVEVASQRHLDVDWRFIALRIVNEDKDYEKDFSKGYVAAHGTGLKLLRVCAAVRAEEGPGPIGGLYTRFGTDLHVEDKGRGSGPAQEAVCGAPRSDRFSSERPGKLATVTMASQRRTASAPRGTQLITGPKKDCRVPSSPAKVRIGVPTSLPTRLSASLVSSRRTSSHVSSLAAGRYLSATPALRR